MIKKNKVPKIRKLRRSYISQDIFFYEPQEFFEKIKLLRERIEDYYELIKDIHLLEKNISSIQILYTITEHIEVLIYKFTDGTISKDVNIQDDLFGEQGDSIIDILPVLEKNDVGLLTTDTDQKLDSFLEEFQEKINTKVKGIHEVGNDLYHMLQRSL